MPDDKARRQEEKRRAEARKKAMNAPEGKGTGPGSDLSLQQGAERFLKREGDRYLAGDPLKKDVTAPPIAAPIAAPAPAAAPAAGDAQIADRQPPVSADADTIRMRQGYSKLRNELARTKIGIRGAEGADKDVLIGERHRLEARGKQFQSALYVAPEDRPQADGDREALQEQARSIWEGRAGEARAGIIGYADTTDAQRLGEVQSQFRERYPGKSQDQMFQEGHLLDRIKADDAAQSARLAEYGLAQEKLARPGGIEFGETPEVPQQVVTDRLAERGLARERVLADLDVADRRKALGQETMAAAEDVAATRVRTELYTAKRDEATAKREAMGAGAALGGEMRLSIDEQIPEGGNIRDLATYHASNLRPPNERPRSPTNDQMDSFLAGIGTTANFVSDIESDNIGASEKAGLAGQLIRDSMISDSIDWASSVVRWTSAQQGAQTGLGPVMQGVGRGIDVLRGRDRGAQVERLSSAVTELELLRERLLKLAGMASPDGA